MRFATVLWPCALVAACTQQAPERAPQALPSNARISGAPSEPSAAAQSSSTFAPVASLAGEWRVAGIDGAEFNEPYGLALSGDAQELWWAPRCARFVRSYRIEGTSVSFHQVLDEPKPGAVPPPVCTIAPPPRIADVTRALDAATTIGRTPGNGIEISGGGHSVTLFSQ